jgi:predicted DsbA family dithiol-disulfide isomerase
MIEVFADIWCPFAHVGLQMTRRQRDARAPGAAIRVRAWPLELVNGEPQDAQKAAEHIHDLCTQLGVDLFNGFSVETFPRTTLPALALVAAAERAGRGEAASYRVRHALWEEGRDIGQPEVVAQLAVELDVVVNDADTQTVRDDWHDGQRRGVQGSPHFFCGDREAFCPSLVIEHDSDGDLHVRPDPSRLAAFLDACWP